MKNDPQMEITCKLPTPPPPPPPPPPAPAAPPPPPPPPDGGYGWVVDCSCFTLNCFTWGVTASYGVYLSHYLMSRRFHQVSSLDYCFVGGFNFAFAMLVAPLATILTREFGKRWTLSIGALLQCGGYIAASFVAEVWQLYLSKGALVGMSIGFIIVPSMAILSQWFSGKRSIANGLYLGRVRNRNRHIRPPQLEFDIRLIRRYEVVMLLLWAFISIFGYITLLFSLSDFALSIGLSPAQSTDTDTTSFRLTASFSLLCGAILGIFWMTIGPLCAEVVGLKDLPSALSLSCTGTSPLTNIGLTGTVSRRGSSLL
ncbi:major facilitator superfamily domain-containing protein [Cladorrhinum sp. PSN259]|nr:major facilitator superfamily domain-containing protein [Cladorrhinum sp. PSN259]